MECSVFLNISRFFRPEAASHVGFGKYVQSQYWVCLLHICYITAFSAPDNPNFPPNLHLEGRNLFRHNSCPPQLSSKREHHCSYSKPSSSVSSERIFLITSNIFWNSEKSNPSENSSSDRINSALFFYMLFKVIFKIIPIVFLIVVPSLFASPRFLLR